MIFGMKSEDSRLKEKMEKLEKENRKMRAALEFYADSKSWEAGYKYRDDDDGTIFNDGVESGATVDKGSRAFRVLKEIDDSAG